MSEINCNNCAISDFKESLCERCDEMKRLGRAEDIEELIIECLPSVQPEVDCHKCVFSGFAGFKQFQTAQSKTEERTVETAQNVSDSDLISRKTAIDVLHGYFDGMLETDTICPKDLYNLFEVLPSVQQEIIRCKDCKHYVVHSFFGRSQGWCERLCDEFDKSLARGTEPDDYCSRAEPYKEEQE